MLLHTFLLSCTGSVDCVCTLARRALDLVHICMQLILPVVDDFLFILLLHFLLLYLLLKLLKPLNFMIALCKLLNRVLILLLQKEFKLISRKFGVLDFEDLNLTHINDFCREGVA